MDGIMPGFVAQEQSATSEPRPDGQACKRLKRHEVEWLRCLIISRRLVPELPEDVLDRLVIRNLVDMSSAKPVITQRGMEMLAALSCTPPAPPADSSQLKPKTKRRSPAELEL